MEVVEPTFTVVPGERIGPFRLGMSLHSALGELKHLSSQWYGDAKASALHFSRTSPYEKPIILEVKSLGINLRFEPENQVLVIIDVYDIGISPLDFQGLVVGGKSRTAQERGVLRTMYEVLGVTHSGFRREDLGTDTFCLQYPGLLVAFDVPSKENVAGIPLALSDGTSPALVRVTVHEFDFGKSPSPARLLMAPAKKQVEILISDDKNVELSFRQAEYLLVLGLSSAQDVLSCLGSSYQLFYKQDEAIGTKARRKERQADQPAAETMQVQPRDYFLNYFDQGLDILLDGRTHVLKKIILRTNLIAHPAFGQYEKCSFTVRYAEKITSTSRRTHGGNGSSAGGKSRKPVAAPTFEDLLASPAAVTEKTVLISCDENWRGVAKKLDIDDKPMMNEKADQPFGPCYLYGYRRSVFEVDKASGHIASLTLF